MNTKKITASEISQSSVAMLPTRPNAPYAFGGNGYSASTLKAAFDALPKLIAERLNALIDDICESDGGSITDAIPTGISDGHTLANMIEDVTSGAFISYLAAPTGSVAEYLLALREDVDKLASSLGIEL